MNLPAASCRATALRISVALAFSCLAALSAESQSGYAVRWTSNERAPHRWILEVTAANASALSELRRAQWTPSQWQHLLRVHAEQGDVLGSIGLPAMLGTYRVGTNRIEFEPLFRLEPGVKYSAAFFPARLPGNESADTGVLRAVFELPQVEVMPSTIVAHIYPSAGVLPENLLKFYLHFSAPMMRGHIYQHIHLRNEAGQDVELPFLELDEELWNPDLTRLTLFLDPGRIKRGVQPLEEVGTSLEAGRRYTLVIDSQWQDSRGAPLKEGFQKSFRVGSPDREPVQPARWRIHAPSTATRHPLTIHFGESLDHALARRVIHVADASARSIPGEIALDDQERRWSFTPAHPWRSGGHTLLIQNTIEDLAGNNVGKSFEVDLFEGTQRRFTNTTVKLPFTVR